MTMNPGIYFVFLDKCFLCALSTADVTVGAVVGNADAVDDRVSSATSTISNFAREPNRERTGGNEVLICCRPQLERMNSPFAFSLQSQICRPLACPPKANVNGKSGLAIHALMRP